MRDVLVRLSLKRKGLDGVSIIVNGGEVKEKARGGKAKRASLARVHVEFADKVAVLCELHDLTGMGCIAIDRVTVGGEQMSVWREYQRKRPSQVRIGKYGVPFVHRAGSMASMRNGEDGIVVR